MQSDLLDEPRAASPFPFSTSPTCFRDWQIATSARAFMGVTHAPFRMSGARATLGADLLALLTRTRAASELSPDSHRHLSLTNVPLSLPDPAGLHHLLVLVPSGSPI